MTFGRDDYCSRAIAERPGWTGMCALQPQAEKKWLVCSPTAQGKSAASGVAFTRNGQSSFLAHCKYPNGGICSGKIDPSRSRRILLIGVDALLPPVLGIYLSMDVVGFGCCHFFVETRVLVTAQVFDESPSLFKIWLSCAIID